MLTQCNFGPEGRFEPNEAICEFIDYQDYVRDVQIEAPDFKLYSDRDLVVWFEYHRKRLPVMSGTWNLIATLDLYLRDFEPGYDGSHTLNVTPWIDVPHSQPCGTLVQFTGRYPSSTTDECWNQMLERFGRPELEFLGLEEERQAFNERFSTAAVKSPASWLVETACRIAGCDRLLSNQSSCLAVAHGLGAPVAVEVSQNMPDVVFLRDNAEYFGMSDDRLQQLGVSM